MRMRRSRVAECLQRRVQLGFELELGFEDLGLGVGEKEEDDVAAAEKEEDEEGMMVVVANRKWRMLEKHGGRGFCNFSIFIFF